MKNFKGYCFRCSQLSKIISRNLKKTEDVSALISSLTNEKEKLVNERGNKVKWTETKQKALYSNQELLRQNNVVNGYILPKTMVTELKKIHRAETYNRNFIFTNKYLVKGITQENEAITLYQNYRNAKGIKTFFVKNTERLGNGFVSGEWDLPTLTEIQKNKEGFDIKCSWDLSTFPFKEEPLDKAYEFQNQGYMFLTGAEKWTTAYCLVNNTEYGVFNEKQKFYHALQHPEEQEKQDTFAEKEEQERYLSLISNHRDIEKMMIFDYDRFKDVNPGHVMEISKEEWHGNNWDIPMMDRVIEKTIERSESDIELIKEMVEIGREYLCKLSN